MFLRWHWSEAPSPPLDHLRQGPSHPARLPQKIQARVQNAKAPSSPFGAHDRGGQARGHQTLKMAVEIRHPGGPSKRTTKCTSRRECRSMPAPAASGGVEPGRPMCRIAVPAAAGVYGPTREIRTQTIPLPLRVGENTSTATGNDLCRAASPEWRQSSPASPIRISLHPVSRVPSWEVADAGVAPRRNRKDLAWCSLAAPEARSRRSSPKSLLCRARSSLWAEKAPEVVRQWQRLGGQPACNANRRHRPRTATIGRFEVLRCARRNPHRLRARPCAAVFSHRV